MWIEYHGQKPLNLNLVSTCYPDYYPDKEENDFYYIIFYYPNGKYEQWFFSNKEERNKVYQKIKDLIKPEIL